MGTQMQPFNIRLLRLSQIDKQRLKPITVLDIYDGASKNFHPKGLFSTDIFGKAGSPDRMSRFSYINLHADIFHPVAFKALVNLKELYGGIMSGKDYAVWDPAAKDFVRSDAISGETGYSFFLKFWKNIKFEDRNSDQRKFNIGVLEKYREEALLDAFLVMPAGYRDLEISADGRPTEDEINGLYRRALSISDLMKTAKGAGSLQTVDSSRYNLQQALCAIYEYIKTILDGKNKHVQGRVATRKIFDSTRNVITASLPVGVTPDDPRQLGPNDTPIGIYQYMVGLRPIAYHRIRNGLLREVFPGANAPGLLVNKKTLLREIVQVKSKDRDSWMTREGLEKRFKRYGISSMRHETAMCGEHYIALIYLDEVGRCMVLHSIDDLPSNLNKKYVRPITVSEIFYLAMAETTRQYPSFLTRYPVTGYGSIYPTNGYLRTTIKSLRVQMLAPDGVSVLKMYHEFPIVGEDFYESMSPSTYNLGRLGGDHDGDMTSWISLMTEEAINEARNKLKDPSYYVTIDKKLYYRTSNDVLDLLLDNMCS